MTPTRHPFVNAATRALIVVAAASTLAVPASSAPAAKPGSTSPTATGAKAEPAARPGQVAHAVFAGGCFWCIETAYEGVPGVKSVVSGYAGGVEKSPTYDQVSSGATGHYESVDVAYDPAQVGYEKLLDIFWHNVDPTQDDGQFCDRGHQYRSAIFYADSAQALLALRSKQAIERSGVLKAPIVTEIRPAGRFWPAEEYHQDFWKKDPVRYYSYRAGCGRDRRLDQIWGKDARRGSPKH
jgi:peptide-methionine (S)-S-oxide reductase